MNIIYLLFGRYSRGPIVRDFWTGKFMLYVACFDDVWLANFLTWYLFTIICMNDNGYFFILNLVASQVIWLIVRLNRFSRCGNFPDCIVLSILIGRPFSLLIISILYCAAVITDCIAWWYHTEAINVGNSIGRGRRIA